MITSTMLIRKRIFPNNINMRQMSVLAKSLKYSEHGEPLDVLELVEQKLDAPTGNQVLVKVLAAPINPADVNTIQGRYVFKPKLPAVAGGECVAEVIAVGEKVSTLQPGAYVVPIETGLGTWTTHALFDAQKLMTVSNQIGLVEAATIKVNPSTAYRMLKDFVDLKPGDTVLQNGANSAVGQAVHQLCKAWQLNSVGVVRNRATIAELKQQLMDLGATEVLTEEELQSTTIFKDGQLKRPQLALNCVGGPSATNIARHLDNKGILVTYGGMSRQPIEIPTSMLIFKDIRFCGYRITEFFEKRELHRTEFDKMFADLCQLIEQGKFVAPRHELLPLENFKNAAPVLNFESFANKKFIFKMIA